MKKLILISIIFILFFIGMKTVKTNTYTVPKEAIRLRVLANSNNATDQKVKFEVSDKVEETLYNILKDTKGIDEARRLINLHINDIDEDIEKVLKKNDYPFSYEVKYGLNFFPEKKYKGITYEEGYYESLLITLGSGNGNNWWCVLFPPLCIMEAEETDKKEVEYKFFIKELIDKYM